MESEERAGLLSRLKAASNGGEALALDLRPAEEYQRVRLTRSVNIPLEELPERFFELPSRETRFFVVVSAGAEKKIPTKSGSHNWCVTDYFEASEAFWQAARLLQDGQGGVSEGGRQTANGSQCRPQHLWRPCDILDDVLEAAGTRVGSALDVGCGSGRDTVYLASRGWHVVGLDNLVAALERARQLASRFGCSGRVDLVQCDLRNEGSMRRLMLCRGNAAPRFDMILVVRFIERPLMPALVGALREGGYFVYGHFLEDDGAEGGAEGEWSGDSKKRLKKRAAKWPEERKPLKRGELLSILRALHTEWEVILLDETKPASLGDKRPFVRLVAKKKKLTG